MKSFPLAYLNFLLYILKSSLILSTPSKHRQLEEQMMEIKINSITNGQIHTGSSNFAFFVIEKDPAMERKDLKISVHDSSEEFSNPDLFVSTVKANKIDKPQAKKPWRIDLLFPVIRGGLPSGALHKPSGQNFYLRLLPERLFLPAPSEPRK